MSKLDKAREQTDKKLKKLIKKLQRFYNKSESEIRKKWDEYLNEQNELIKDLQKEYDDAKAAGNTKEARRIGKQLGIEKANLTIKNKYFKDMVDRVTTEIAHVNETATAYINGEIPEFYATNINGANAYIVDVIEENDMKYAIDYRFDLMDSDTAKLLLTSESYYAPLFRTVDIEKDKRWNTKLIYSQVSQGILQGEAIPKIAERIKNVTGANEASAVRHARTMCTSAENIGRMDCYARAEENGIILEKQWIAAVVDGRTRDWHAELNGVAIPVDEYFENSVGKILYPGDTSADPSNYFNCRCTLGAKVIGFRRKDGTVSYVG